MKYRIAIPASVCIDVAAGSDEEAISKAKAVIDDNCDGLDVWQLGDGARLYLSEQEDPTVEDVEGGDDESEEV